MTTAYPTGLDTTATHPAAAGVGANLSTFPHSTIHGNSNDAIIAIETELGVAPSGAETTVKARLDRITPTLGALTSWTPAVTQLGSVTVTNTHSTYMRIGRLVFAQFLLAVTGSGTAANVITISLPVNSTGTGSTDVMGYGYLVDSSASLWFHGGIQLASLFACRIMSATGQAPFTALGTTSFAGALASGDSISGFVWYEAAAD